MRKLIQNPRSAVAAVSTIIGLMAPLNVVLADTETLIQWAYVQDGGILPEFCNTPPIPVGCARVIRSSNKDISVRKEQQGVYVVTFPEPSKNLGVTATLNNSVGFITAIPGDNTGLLGNQVKVLTFSFAGVFEPRHFTVVVYSNQK